MELYKLPVLCWVSWASFWKWGPFCLSCQIYLCHILILFYWYLQAVWCHSLFYSWHWWFMSYLFSSVLLEVYFIVLFKNQVFISWIFYFSAFNFIDSCSSLYYVLFVCFGFILLLFFQVLDVGTDITDLRLFLFSNISTSWYKFPFQCSFNFVPWILIICIFIFVQSNIFFIVFEISAMTHELFKSVFFSF